MKHPALPCFFLLLCTCVRARLGPDRKVFNVEKSIAAAGGSAEDLLRQIPSITVDLEGNVSLRGGVGEATRGVGQRCPVRDFWRWVTNPVPAARWDQGSGRYPSRGIRRVPQGKVVDLYRTGRCYRVCPWSSGLALPCITSGGRRCLAKGIRTVHHKIGLLLAAPRSDKILYVGKGYYRIFDQGLTLILKSTTSKHLHYAIFSMQLTAVWLGHAGGPGKHRGFRCRYG